MRGKFIVFEGLDRSGKSTAISQITEFLRSKGLPVKQICYPNRSTSIGGLIDSVLASNTKIGPEAIHLLFSANRWEENDCVAATLANGTNVICDRYWYSGTAYSVAKGLSLQWCLQSDRNLIEPDYVIFLEGDPAELAKRSDYGKQKFEKVDFQQKVLAAYTNLWQHAPPKRLHRVNVNNSSPEDVNFKVKKIIESILIE